MIKHLQKSTNFIVNLGITDEVTAEKQLRFKLVNIMTFLSAICDLLFVLIAKFYLELDSFAVGLGVTFILLVSSLVLMFYKMYNCGRLLALFASVVGGFSAQYFIGAEARIEILAFIQIIYVCTFFTIDEKKLIGIGSLFAFTYLTLCYGIQFNLIAHESITLNKELLTSYNFISTFTIISLVGIFLMTINNEYFKAREVNVELNKDLNRNLEVKHTLNKIVVHDLATPLMLIKGLSERLLTLNRGDHREVGIINNAALNIEIILKSVNEMMVDAKKINEKKEDIVLSELLAELLENLSSILKEKNINVVLNIDPSLSLFTNKTVLQNNILVNIMTNAIKFSNPYSSITINAYENQKNTLIHILDSGPGMTPEKLKTIYNFDLNISTKGTSGEKGTGYGLPIVKFSTGLLKGSIEARNRIDANSGLEFILKLPMV
jgi:signal transduction histidine kinase